jgi:SAM-dependent methyltransferase
MPVTVSDPYQRIAALYDLEHDAVTDDAELYAAIADQVEGPVLEMGCGSGRLLVPIAEAGHHITGIDRSATMLDRARTRLLSSGNAGTRVTLHEGDMESAGDAPGGPFGLVLYSLNSLMHLDDPDSQLQSLRSSRAAMRPHGQVIIDVMNPTPQYLVELGRGPIHEWSSETDDGGTIDKWSIRQIDPVSQAIETTLWYDQADRSGHLVRTRTSFVLRYVHAAELSLMLELAGFRDIRLFGSLEFEPLDEGSERILAVAAASASDDE